MGALKVVANSNLRVLKAPLPNLFLLCRNKCHRKNGAGNNSDDFPEEPTTCCMSGCANCVWLEYADKLSKYCNEGGEEVVRKINESVTDPSMKAFLLHEWRMRKQEP